MFNRHRALLPPASPEEIAEGGGRRREGKREMNLRKAPVCNMLVNYKGVSCFDPAKTLVDDCTHPQGL